MRCSRCQTANPPGAKFCLECGVALRARCESCGAVLPPAARLCLECAQPVRGAAAGAAGGPRFASPEAYTPRHLAEKIRTSRTAWSSWARGAPKMAMIPSPMTWFTVPS